jgi:hypothetical protein
LHSGLDLARAGTGGGLEWLFSVIAVELRTLSAVRHTLIEVRCVSFMRVYDQVSARKRRQQAARTSGLFHMSPELIIKETTFKALKDLKGDVRNAQSVPTRDSYVLAL